MRQPTGLAGLLNRVGHMRGVSEGLFGELPLFADEMSRRLACTAKLPNRSHQPPERMQSETTRMIGECQYQFCSAKCACVLSFLDRPRRGP